MLPRLRKPQTVTVYDTIGGHDALEVVVEDFYCRVLEDDHLANFFAASDMKRLKAKMVELLAAALGCQQRYTGQSMTRAHHDRGIMMSHFALMTGHLKDSVSAAGWPPEAVAEILGFITQLAGDIALDHTAARV
jgi:hemoglobin